MLRPDELFNDLDDDLDHMPSKAPVVPLQDSRWKRLLVRRVITADDEWRPLTRNTGRCPRETNRVRLWREGVYISCALSRHLMGEDRTIRVRVLYNQRRRMVRILRDPDGDYQVTIKPKGGCDHIGGRRMARVMAEVGVKHGHYRARKIDGGIEIDFNQRIEERSSK